MFGFFKKTLFLLSLIVVGYCIYTMFFESKYEIRSFLMKEWAQNDKLDSFCTDLSKMSSEWDTIYHYRGDFPASEINKRHGTDFENLHIGCRIVYKLRGVTVAQESYETVCSGIIPTISFYRCDENWCIDRNNAKFSVKKYGEEFYLRRDTCK